MGKPKMIIFGLDGATFEVINKHLDMLPNLKNLMENGVWGELESVIPTDTAVAWPAMCTGKNPGKLGIFDFMMRDPKTMKLHLIDFSRLSFKFFWNYLDKSLKVGLASIPAIPFQKTEFFVQGSLVNLPPDGTCVVRGEKIKPPPYYDYYIDWRDGPEKMVKDLRLRVSQRIEFFKELFKRCNPDLAFFVFNAPDHIQHHFWGFMDESYPLFKENKFKDTILDVYRQIDRGIGEILGMVEKNEVYVVVVSDHGFGPHHSTINVNCWLMSEGYLKLKQSLKFSASKTMWNLAGMLIPDFIKRALLKLYISARNVEVNERLNIIDWSKTRAYSRGYDSPIYINLKGREPYGTVEASEYEPLRDEIIGKLEDLKDPETGEKVVERVYRREEIYYGEFLDIAPDILIVPKRGYWVDDSFMATAPITRKKEIIPNSGMHRLEGVFILSGPNVKKGVKVEGIRIYDVAPTILHIFGCPIPLDMDGRVVKEVFIEDSEPYKRPVKYQAVEEEYGEEPKALVEGEETVKERLRRLGYIE